MADVKAVAIIREEIKNVRAIPNPPSDYDASAQYKQKVNAVVDKAYATTKKVSDYATVINENQDELRNALKESTTKIQKAIRKVLDSIKVGKGHVPTNILKYMQELAQAAQTLQRLDEFVLQTESVIAKIHETGNSTFDDIEDLKGCLNSWENEKLENYEDEKRRLAEEKRKREEEERARKEEAEKRKKEEEERKRREKEEQKKREEEERERKRKEEEEAREAERQAELEAERFRLEEEERLKREEEEGKLRDEQERKMREENERKRRIEEEEARKEAERKRKEAERLERERQKREEESIRMRLDPNNWKPVVYDRDAVDGNTSYHKGVCCMLASPPESITKDDVDCLASDEDDGIIEILEDGEKIASSVIQIKSTKGTLKTEVPVRAYIPHCPVTDPGDEIVMKMSINGSDWLTKTPELPSANAFTKDNIKLLGVQLYDFDQAKIVVIARRKNQNIIVDKPGTSQYSTYDKNIKLFVPREAFNEPTELKLAVRPITDDTLSSISDSSDCQDSVISTSSLITLSCQKPPTKDIEIDLIRPTQVTDQKVIKGKLHQLYRTRENVWKVAEAEYKNRHKDVSVTLPANKEKYTLIEIETQQNVTREDVLRIAESIYDVAHKSVVRLILKQKQTNPSVAMVHCVRRELVTQRLTELQEMQYTLGADVSREFCVKDGQKLRVTCSGNIDTTTGTDGQNFLTFYTYMDSAKQEMILHVKDKYKQRDLGEYLGNLKFEVQADNRADASQMWATGTTLEMPMSLPKTEHIRLNLKSARVRFPPYLTALTGFLSWKLTDTRSCTVEWLDVVVKLDDKKKIQSFLRMAKNKCDENDERAICRSILTDWMKATPRQEDKMQPIHHMLSSSGLHELSRQCEDFVEYHKEKLSNTKLTEVSEHISGDSREIGEKLSLPDKTIEKCMKDSPGSSSDQIMGLLMEWRQSDDAVFAGTDALKHLQKILNF